MFKNQLTSFHEAALFRSQVIDRWKPPSEVWPFTHGDDVLGTLTVLGSTATTYSFRKALNLRPYARVTCYAPVVGVTAIGCYLFHNYVISNDILTAKVCPLCISLKASSFQSLFAFGFPLILAPTVCFYMADKLLTYPVPPLVRAPKEVFNTFRKIILKTYRPILIIGVIQIAAAWFITYKKEKSFCWVQSVLKERKY